MYYRFFTSFILILSVLSLELILPINFSKAYALSTGEESGTTPGSGEDIEDAKDFGVLSGNVDKIKNFGRNRWINTIGLLAISASVISLAKGCFSKSKDDRGYNCAASTVISAGASILVFMGQIMQFINMKQSLDRKLNEFENVDISEEARKYGAICAAINEVDSLQEMITEGSSTSSTDLISAINSHQGLSGLLPSGATNESIQLHCNQYGALNAQQSVLLDILEGLKAEKKWLIAAQSAWGLGFIWESITFVKRRRELREFEAQTFNFREKFKVTLGDIKDVVVRIPSKGPAIFGRCLEAGSKCLKAVKQYSSYAMSRENITQTARAALCNEESTYNQKFQYFYKCTKSLLKCEVALFGVGLIKGLKPGLLKKVEKAKIGVTGDWKNLTTMVGAVVGQEVATNCSTDKASKILFRAFKNKTLGEIQALVDTTGASIDAKKIYGLIKSKTKEEIIKEEMSKQLGKGCDKACSGLGTEVEAATQANLTIDPDLEFYANTGMNVFFNEARANGEMKEMILSSKTWQLLGIILKGSSVIFSIIKMVLKWKDELYWHGPENRMAWTAGVGVVITRSLILNGRAQKMIQSSIDSLQNVKDEIERQEVRVDSINDLYVGKVSQKLTFKQSAPLRNESQILDRGLETLCVTPRACQRRGVGFESLGKTVGNDSTSRAMANSPGVLELSTLLTNLEGRKSMPKDNSKMEGLLDRFLAKAKLINKTVKKKEREVNSILKATGGRAINFERVGNLFANQLEDFIFNSDNEEIKKQIAGTSRIAYNNLSKPQEDVYDYQLQKVAKRESRQDPNRVEGSNGELMSDYDITLDSISNKKNENIFKLISNRYMKTVLPMLMNK